MKFLIKTKDYFSEILRSFNFFRLVMLISIICIGTYVLDYNDGISSIMHFSPYLFFFLVCSTVLVFIYYFSKYFLPNIFSKEVNSIDFYCLSFSISLCILFLIYLDNSRVYWNYKTSIICILLFIGISFIIYRLIMYKNFSKMQLDETVLEKLIEGKELKPEEKNVLFSDNASYIDLLDRKDVIAMLYDSIEFTKNTDKFTIGFVGEWGSGKTSVLNFLVNSHLEKEKEYIVIRFEAWEYNDEKSLLKAMISKIIQKVNIGILSFQQKQQVIKYIGTMFNQNGNLITSLLDLYTTMEDSDLIRLIEGKLVKNNKRVIFIIDNIDRMQPDNILFIYKSVASLVNINHITYVLAYDEEQIKKIFGSLQIDYKYLDKIINRKIELTNSLDTQTSVIKKILNNYLILVHEISDDKIDDVVLSSLVKTIPNLRDLKIYLNNLGSLLRRNYKDLDINDVLTIFYIRNSFPELYMEVYKNRHFFVTEKASWSRMHEYLGRIDMKQYDNKAKQYFKTFYAENDNKSGAVQLLELIFPVLKRFSQNQDLYHTDSDSVKKSTIDKRISNAQYIDLYFFKNENEYLLINKFVTKMIDNYDDFELVYQLIESPSTTQDMIVEEIDLRIDTLNNKDRFKVFNILTTIYNFLNDYPNFGVLNAQSRSAFTVSKLLMDMNDDVYKNSVKELTVINNIPLLYSLKYWMSSERKKIDRYDENKELIIKENLKQLTDRVIDNNENIYNDENYVFKIGTYLYWDRNYSKDIVIKYFRTIIDSLNIFRFIYDFVVISVGTNGYGYQIHTDEIFKIFNEYEINQIISKTDPNEDENFVIEIYKNSIDKQMNAFSEAIHLNNPRKIKI